MSRSAPRLLAAVALPALLLAACQEAAEPVAERAPPVVQTVDARTVSMADSRTYSGVVKPRSEFSAAFRIGGRIVERLKDVGDPVAAGEVVARLDPADLDLQVAQAEASVAAATSNLERATADLARARTLLDKGHAADTQWEGRRLARDEAEARLATATKQLELARNARTYADLVAPVDGVVSAVRAEAGEVVGQGAPVLVIAEAGAAEVLVAIPESRIGDLDGSTAAIALWAGDRGFAGRVTEIAPEADPATRTYDVRFEILDPDPEVRFGMTASVTLTRGDPAPVVRLPATAVLDDGRGPVVFLVDPATGTVARRSVEIGRFETAAVVVTEGLSGGEQVVAMGVNRLVDGEAVRVAAY